MIEASNTATVYTLTVYEADTKAINSKTPSTGSTTFMLNPNQPTKTENGITIIDRTVGSTRPDGSSATFMQRLDRLEQENKDLLTRLHNEEMKNLEQRMEQRISGLSQVPEQTWWEKMIDTLTNKPEVIQQISGSLGKLIHGEQKDYIQKQVPINGTENKDVVMEEETQTTYKDPGLTKEQIEELEEEQQLQLQEYALESLESRIGIAVVTRMTLHVAALNDKDLNKLLNYLD